jgi:hypothetical protein
MKKISNYSHTVFGRLTSPASSFGLLLVLGGSLLLSGCETPGESAFAGAGAGALMGGMLKGNRKGMVQGAAIGAAGGYALGAYGQAERQRGYAQGSAAYSGQASAPEYEQAPPPEPRYRHDHYSAPQPEPILYGRYSGRHGFVYSPYGRRGIVDVRGLPRGAQVLDPACGRIFLIP